MALSCLGIFILLFSFFINYVSDSFRDLNPSLEESAAPENLIEIAGPHITNYDEVKTYYVAGTQFDLQQMSSVSQFAEEVEIEESIGDKVIVYVENQYYFDLSPVKIEGQTYPETVMPYLEQSEKVTWAGEEILDFVSEIQDYDVLSYVRAAMDQIGKTVTHEYNPALITNWTGKNSEDVLAEKTGFGVDYINLFLACLRAKGIPARFVEGIQYEKSTERDFLYSVWAEFYLQDYGWIPVSPVDNRLGIGDTYIKLYVGTDLEDIGILFDQIGITHVELL